MRPERSIELNGTMAHTRDAMGSPTRPFLACWGGIQSLKITSAKRSAASQARDESLWQPRGYDRNVRDHAEFKE
jgi:hypothetical protein